MDITTLKRISKVIQIEATTPSIGDFLVSHVPFENLYLEPEGKNSISEEQLLNDIMLKDPEEHKFIMVQGGNGSGKSHLIRWIKEKYVKKVDEKKEAVLLISRAHNTLQDAMAQLLESDIFPDEVKENELKAIKNAKSNITGEELKKTINFNFTLEIDADEKNKDGIIDQRTRKMLSTYLKDDYIQKQFLLAKGGPIERIRAKIENVSEIVNVGDDPMFAGNDFAISYSQMSKNLKVAEGRAADYTIRLAERFSDSVNGADLRQKTVDYLNTKVSNVIQRSMKLQTADFKNLFASLRKNLKKQGMNLTLFVEDINAFTGIDEALMEVLLTDHNAEGNGYYCRIISVVGSTNYFYNSKLNTSIKERIKSNIYIFEKSVLGNKEQLARFAAKYINAINLSEDKINAWVESGAYEVDLPVFECNYKWADIDCNGKKLSIFPFNDTALWKLYDTLPQDKKTPRVFLKSVIAHFMKLWVVSSDTFLSDENKFINADITMPAWENPLYKQRNNNIDPNSAVERGILLKVWGDGTAKLENGLCGGLTDDVFKSFNVYSGIKGQPIPGNPSTTPLDPPTPPPGPTIPLEPVQPVKPEKLIKIEEDLERWLNNKQNLANHIELRELLQKFIISGVNWKIEEVPMLLVDKYLVLGRIHIEGQNVSISDGIVLKRNEETYYLLLALAYCKYVGGNAWGFDGFEDHLVAADAWLGKHRQDIVDKVNAPKDKADLWDLSLWNVAALFCLKTMFGGMDISKPCEDIAVDLLGFNVNFSEKTIHSDEWQNLKNDVLKNSDFREDIYKDALAYFSKSVGSATAGETSYIFVDGCELVRQVCKLKSIDWKLEGICPEVSENNRDVWYNAVRLINKFNKKVPIIIEEEINKADKYLQLFSQIFDNDFSEASVSDSIGYVNDFLLFLTNNLNLSYNAADYEVVKSSSSVINLVSALNKAQDLKSCKTISEKLMKISKNPFEDMEKYYSSMIAFNNLLNDKETNFNSSVDTDFKNAIQVNRTKIYSCIDEIIAKLEVIGGAGNDNN